MNYDIPKTELVFKKSLPIDYLNIKDAINLMTQEQNKASEAVRKSIKTIESGVIKIVKHLKSFKKGRLIYVGAGTSGRIGIQDGVELLPTFSWPKDRMDFIIAGGSNAVFNSVENAEDDTISAKKIVDEKLINSNDVVIGLAASGNTFTCKVLEEAKSRKPYYFNK